MASRRLCISASHAYDARPVRPRVPRGGHGAPPCPGHGGGGLGVRVGEGGGVAPTWAHAREHNVEGMATTFVHLAQGGGIVSTHVHASTRWKDWASTRCACRHRVEGTVGVTPLPPTPAPLPFKGLWDWCNGCTRATTHERMLVHQVYCCNSGSVAAMQPDPAPLPPRCYGVAATAALKLQHTHGSNCSPCLAAILALHPHHSQARSITNRGATGVLQDPHSAGCPRTAAPKPVSCRTGGTAAAPQPAPPRPITNRGAEAGEGQRGMGGTGGFDFI